MLGLLVVFTLIKDAVGQLQSCADGGVGPCLNGIICPSPTTQTCITTATGQLCCENSQIVSATTSAPCVDLVNPRTGVSDCPNVAYLCNNAVYYNLMTQQCPKTCNRCTPGTGTGNVVTSNCRDLVNPRTGVSNCAQMVSYCRHPLYINLMRQQCPKTCRYC